MPNAENKVRFTLKNVHYAVLSNTDGAATWALPVKVPGAVNLSLEPQGDVTAFYADGMVYYQAVANNGYQGDLEMARFPDKMMEEVWGFEKVDTDMVLLETSTTEAKAFALLFQIDGDADNEFYVMYNCSGTKPSVGAATSTEKKEPQTQKSQVSAVALDNGWIMARTTAQTPSTVKEGWFAKVWEKKESTGA